MKLRRIAVALPFGLLIGAASLAISQTSGGDREILVAGAEGIPVPKRTRYVPPRYPAVAVEQGLRGIVIVEIVIGTDGRVASAQVTRSLPPFDEAALDAARQWRYEPVRVGGRAVSVRLTIPVSFAIRLPELTGPRGMPELRAGGTPEIPPGTLTSALVTAEIDLGPDGAVTGARAQNAETPCANALLLALRTWRFAVAEDAGSMRLRLEARFLPDRKRVTLRVTSVSTSLSTSLEGEETAEAPPTVAAPAGGSLAAAAPPSPAPSVAASAGESLVASPPPSPAPTGAPPVPAEMTPTRAAPVVETLSAPPPPTPTPEPTPPSIVESGVSSIKDVSLAAGVPDLIKGRRPVTPPLARLNDHSGVVTVEFALEASGLPVIQATDGPDSLRRAAQEVVGSWAFRRQSVERLFLVATLTYRQDGATAAVRRR